MGRHGELTRPRGARASEARLKCGPEGAPGDAGGMPSERGTEWRVRAAPERPARPAGKFRLDLLQSHLVSEERCDGPRPPGSEMVNRAVCRRSIVA
ncbi:hypothetical protein DM56_4658 [Burkholderia mallei]|nr:hypothetical protein DM75_3920 [Burkholderia mallei]KOS76369.1 hypothetical protein DM46_2755 [Burkholderia mallei]KOS90594.1 hypothetical protein DM53_4228 [Burkholderia mallei]KOS93575.1 hypothetical protein DM45_3600 [Burkholderia mallei]KOS97174.1 hypothetical protein DM49_4112 [Burkholderia mallei]